MASENQNSMIPDWQFNTIPGNANQGSILMTRNFLTEPPLSLDDLIWLDMKDVIGTADVKLEYSEEENKYLLYKSKGHRENNGEWIMDWIIVGSWEPITEEVAEALRSLVYIQYIFDTSTLNTLKVIGVRKDGTQDELCNINFVSAEVLEQAIQNLTSQIQAETTRATNKENNIESNLNAEITRATNAESALANNIQAETTRATNRENQLESMIQQATINPGTAIEVVGDDNQVNVKYDNESIKINAANQLRADVLDDTTIANNRGWSSLKISQELTSAMHYKGQVQNVSDLPATAQNGDVYNVAATGDNYAWNGSSWDNLSGEYINGNGIDITGKNISAKAGEALGFDNYGNIALQHSSGLSVNNQNQLQLNLGNSMKIASNKLDVKANNGLVEDSNGLKINANFNIKTTPLGTDSSKLALYSDGKIAVDFTESPVVLTIELLAEGQCPDGSNIIDSMSVPNMNQYDMYIFELCARVGGNYTSIARDIISKGSDNSIVTVSSVGASELKGGTTAPQGALFFLFKCKVDYTNGLITTFSSWTKSDMNLTDWTSWGSRIGTELQKTTLRVYGIKAR